MKCVGTSAVLEAHLPLTLVGVSVGPLVDTVAVGFGHVPLPDVGVLLSPLPDAVALFEAMDPLSVVDFTIAPGVDSFAMSLSVLELSEVGVALGVPFEAFTFPQVCKPAAFVLAAVFVLHDAQSFATALLADGSNVDRVRVSLNLEPRHRF